MPLSSRARFHSFIFVFLVLIILIGGFLRLYNFSPWLHFELDQARDALVIDAAIQNGPEALPLLGPKAGGTFLRLGPGYYYLSYLSGLIFGGDVIGQILFIPILGTVLIAIFYFFLRRVYPVDWAILGSSWLAVSVYAVMYSRFGWNPNLVPFFALTGFLCLLLSTDGRLMLKKRIWALMGAALCLGMATQMHFLAFLAIPIITFLFLITIRPVFKWYWWLVALLIPILLYVPMFLNETKTEYANTQEFFGAITEKSGKEEKSALEKLIKNTSEYGTATIVVLTGSEKATFPKIDLDGIRLESSECTGACDEGKWLGVLGILLFLVGTGFFIRRIFYYPKKSPERAFFVLVTYWQIIAFILFLPLAYGIAPRFYLLTLPLFFTSFLGIVWEFRRAPKIIGAIVIVALSSGILASNAIHLEKRFTELRLAKSEEVVSAPDRILKEEIRVTKEQQDEIVKRITTLPNVYDKPLYFESVPQYKRALKYGLSQQGLPTDGISKSEIYREGTFVYVIRSRTNAGKSYQELFSKYNLISEEKFGTLTVLILEPRPEAITKDRQVIEPQGMTEGSLAPKRYTWEEWWNEKDTQSLEEDDEGEGEDVN